MNIPEATAFLDWLANYDGRVNSSSASVEIWHNALSAIPTQAAHEAVVEFYRGNDKEAATPAAIRKACYAARDRAIAHDSATKAIAPTANPAATWRQRNPELWDQLFAQGRADGNRDRAFNQAFSEGKTLQGAAA